MTDAPRQFARFEFPSRRVFDIALLTLIAIVISRVYLGGLGGDKPTAKVVESYYMMQFVAHVNSLRVQPPGTPVSELAGQIGLVFGPFHAQRPGSSSCI